MSGASPRGDGAPLGASLRDADPELFELIEAEANREQSTLSMVAAENLVARAVLDAQGSILTNKYADGYPGHRRYDGCAVVDEIEVLAIERAKALFGAEHANVQPYSGTNANYAVLEGLCEPGDVVLGFDAEHGGHRSHYSSDTFSGRFYRGHAYHVRASDRLVDMDEVADLARTQRPRVIFAGWSCYPRYLDFAAFRAIVDEVGAYLVVDMAHFAGLVAAKVHPDPVPFADVCTMTTHKTLGGARGGLILCRAELASAIDEGTFPRAQGAPLMHVIAAKAATFLSCGTEAFASRMRQTVSGARIVAAALDAAESETDISVVTGGTDVHQVVLDTAKTGAAAGDVLERLHAISVNANAMRIAFDAKTPPAASGVRLGSTSLATRGFDDEAFEELGAVLAVALSPARDARHEELTGRTAALASRFPAPR